MNAKTPRRQGRNTKKKNDGMNAEASRRGGESGISIVELLLETAKADTDLLLKNDVRGDVLSVPRAVEFYLLGRRPRRPVSLLTSSTTTDTATRP